MMMMMKPSYDMELVYPPGAYSELHTIKMSSTEEYWEESGNGLTTAEIIAAQSQDYIDEKLAEYQATIQHLQGKKLTKQFLYYVKSKHSLVFILLYKNERTK